MEAEYIALKTLEELQPDKFKDHLESKELQESEGFDEALKYSLGVHFRTKQEELKFKPENVQLMIGILLKRAFQCL